ncbi:hypothetical protein DY000_02000475 [Brassica cretica]|uniref:NFACT RNA-binding domain-containing protein n=1 Tax=Brassica cretica TaxID=69181 RepID=A0ABQ7CA84_BRACR|nr:hypothetical protein DY000_02000475 [Brassica cretica]
MVFYFKARPDAGDYTIFMGLDKFENEELIKYGFPEDVWFHVDKMSSAHVYLRLHKGQDFDDINEGVLEDCAQLVKANSIQGNKVNNVDVVYTPWSNLKKTASMDVGQVGFHNSKMVRTIRVEKRVNDIVNRLNKTKVERTPDLRAEREAVNAAERAERKQHLREKKKREEIERLEKERQAEMRSYKGLMRIESELVEKTESICTGEPVILCDHGLLYLAVFHVDKMSSAHVYLRLHKGQDFDDINEGVLEDCAQLVKANSIQGNKVNNVDVVYTPWSNLKKTASMDVGQVGFHNSKMVRTIRVEKRVNDIVNRLNKTKVERTPDLRAEREAVNAAERAERKQHLREKKKREEIERLEKERQAEMRSYKGLMVTDKMTSNKDIASSNKSLQELEDDFM